MYYGNIRIRGITTADDEVLACLVRDTLTEFGINKPGTAFFEPETDHLSEVFQHPGSGYYVAVFEEEILGGAGIFPTKGLPDDTVELVKMFLFPHARGIGLGNTLIHACITAAQQFNYKNIYLESRPELKIAIKLYEKSGFKSLDKPLGNNGHFFHSIWMLKCIEKIK